MDQRGSMTFGGTWYDEFELFDTLVILSLLL